MVSPLLIAGAVGGANFLSGLAGGFMGKKNAKKAAAQLAALRQYQQQQMDTTLGTYDPYIQGGRSAYDLYNQTALQGDMSNFFTSPDYQFRLGQGINALTGSASARGMLNSSQALKNINDYAQNTAGSAYQQYLNNLTNPINIGLGALGSQNQYRQSYTNNITGIGQQIAEQNVAAKMAVPMGILGGLQSGINSFGNTYGDLGGGFGGGQMLPWLNGGRGGMGASTGFNFGG